MSTQSERAARWREHVERWRRSGQTQAAYSAEHGVSKKSLGYWVRQSRQEVARKPDSLLTLVAARPVGTTPPRQAGQKKGARLALSRRRKGARLGLSRPIDSM